MINKIITSQGNVQFINSKGRIINVHPWHVYSVYEGDTVSFLFIGMKDYSGQAIFASQYEDLEVNGETYDNMDDLKEALTYAFAKAGAQARTEIVTELPEDPYTNTIYLLPKEHGEGYDEYIWNEEQGWQLIGDTDIEWERYLQIADFNAYSAATAEDIAYISGAVDTNAADIQFLSGAVDTEIAAREAADAFISGAVDTVSSDLANEVSRATSAETTLQNNINTVNGRVDAEQIARANADTFISGAVDTEVSNRISADTALQTAIDNEASARTEADATLQTNIDNEASARTDADSALSNKIDYVSGAVDTEVSARTAADEALDSKIDTVSGDVVSEASRASGAEIALGGRIDDEITARTAADTALDAAKADKVNAVASAEYDSGTTTINFKNISGTVISSIDATDFIKDGMIEDVRIENGYLIIDFNTESGIQDIQIPLTDIFNPANYYDKYAIDGIVSGLNEDISEKLAISDFNTYSGDVETALGNKVETSDFETYSGAVDTTIASKFDASGITAYSTSQEVTAEIEAAVSGKVDTTAFTAYSASVETALGNKADLSALTEDEAVWGQALNDINGRINTISGNALSTGDVQTQIDSSISGKVDTTAFTSYSASVETALSGKQDTLSAGTNITIVDNVISAEGGGKAIEAGRGIEITTGETADTVSFNLPISASSKSSENYINIGVFYDFDSISNSKFQNISIGSNNIANSNSTIFHGSNNTSKGNGSFISGYHCQTNGLRSNAFGDYIVSNNEDELSTGKYNVSNTGSTDADKTLFSIGNGTANNARHNAFEIRQNGDIYLSSGGTDIKLQDYLGSTVEVSSAITSGDTNPVEGGVLYDKFDEVESVTARALNDVNEKFGGLKLVKLTQTEYDNLQTKDSNTLYIISD